MAKDFIERWLEEMDNHARDENGSIDYDNKFERFIENMISSPNLEVNAGEDYLDYDMRLNSAYTKRTDAFGNTYSIQTLRKDVDYTYTYVSDALDSTTISNWGIGKNIFISAGTGRGKNTFIKNQLLKHFGSYGQYIIIFENRKSLLSQQTKEMIMEIDKEAFKHQSLEEDSMFTLGSNQNIMLISYQTAALKLLNNDIRFCDFLKKVRYAVFDEVHYLIDDAQFNKGVNIISSLLLTPNAIMSNGNMINTRMPSATQIFMSGSMEEVFLYLQSISSKYVPTPNSYIHKIDYSNFVAQFKSILYNQEKNSIFILPPDYSYVSPRAYGDDSEIISEIGKSEDKWLIFVMSISDGQKLTENLNDRYGAETAIFVNASNRNSKHYKELIETEQFSSKVLVATTVIYNGVNIKDDKLKNIVLPLTTLPIAKQLIGRKRIDLKAPEAVNVYFKSDTNGKVMEHFRNCIMQYIEAKKEETSGIISKIAAINGLIDKGFDFSYSVPDNSGTIMIPYYNYLAWYKLRYETVFYLYVLRRCAKGNSSYVQVMLEGLGISDKFEDSMKAYDKQQKDQIEIAREAMKVLLEPYIESPIADEPINEEYNKITEFTSEFNQIYQQLHGGNFHTQWKSKTRSVPSSAFNKFIDELDLPYEIEISPKDKKTGIKTLTVRAKSPTKNS